MGMYVEVIKSGKENKRFVYYNYQFSCLDDAKTRTLKTVIGLLKIDKRTGDVHTVKLAPNDKGSHARCAAWALIRHWKKGEYPEKTYWES